MTILIDKGEQKENKMKKYEIKSPVVVEDKGKKRIRIMVKIGAIEFPFTSSEIDSNSNEKYFDFDCNDALLSGACKVLGIEEIDIAEQIKSASFKLFNETVDNLKEEQVKKSLETWKNLKYWEFIEEFKKGLPEGCSVNHLTYEDGVKKIKEGTRLSDPFPMIYVKTPYNRNTISIEERQAYSYWHSKPSYTYYEITCGYDQKFGRPRKLENILPKVLKAIETLKAQSDRKKASNKQHEENKKTVLNGLGKSFIAEEERKYSKFRSGRSWVETKYISDELIVRKVTEDKFMVNIKRNLDADQVNKLNEFLKTL